MAAAGQMDTALSLFQQAIETQPTYYYTYLRRAHWLRTLGRFDDALIDLDDCLRLRPVEYDAVEERALILEAMGEDELAVMERSRIPREARQRIAERRARQAVLKEQGGEAAPPPSDRYAERDAALQEAMRKDAARRQRMQGKRGMYVQSDRDRRRVQDRMEFGRTVARLDSTATQQTKGARGNRYVAVGPIAY